MSWWETLLIVLGAWLLAGILVATVYAVLRIRTNERRQ